MAAGVAVLVPGEQRTHDRYGLAQGCKRPRLREAESIEPGPLRQPEEGTPSRDGIEHRDLASDLVGVKREGVERGGPKANALCHTRHQEERADRRLVEEVVERRDDVDAGLVGPARDRLVLERFPVGQEPDAELARYVSSSVTSVRSASRSIRMTTRSSGSGQHTRFSCSSQSS